MVMPRAAMVSRWQIVAAEAACHVTRGCSMNECDSPLRRRTVWPAGKDFDKRRQREVAVGLRADGAGPADVIWIGRVLPRTYLAGFAQDGWLFGGRRHGAHPRSSPGAPSVHAFFRRSVRRWPTADAGTAPIRGWPTAGAGTAPIRVAAPAHRASTRSP